MQVDIDGDCIADLVIVALPADAAASAASDAAEGKPTDRSCKEVIGSNMYVFISIYLLISLFIYLSIYLSLYIYISIYAAASAAAAGKPADRSCKGVICLNRYVLISISLSLYLYPYIYLFIYILRRRRCRWGEVHRPVVQRDD